ncbi:MAG: hypothetical protein NT069_11425 [Planctomycetota bacterium]|nr:hypothetical protein [Planctomycetota bacterium]
MSTLLLVAGLLFASLPSATACPFCASPSLTLAEQLAKSDAAVLVQWVSAEMPDKESIGSTTYAIVDVARAPGKPAAALSDKPKSKFTEKALAGEKPALPKALEKGKKITVDRYREGKAGDLSILLGSATQSGGIEWGNPLEVTESMYQYMIQAPSPETAPEKRLAYFVKFLETGDPVIAGDAYQEFANAPYKDIVALTEKFPREKLRKWVADPKTSAGRLGLYGLMLGLCGTAEDAKTMEEKIVEKSDDYRLGIDGVMGGYLLLTGEKGLDVIEKSKIADPKATFSETYAARQAILFLSSYGAGKIPAKRLLSALEKLLEARPEMADLTIADLARLKDWAIQDRLMELYGTEAFDVPAIKRSIIRYMLASTKDVPMGGNEKLPPHAESGQKHIETLRKRDPKLVAEAEKFFFLN